MNLGELADLTVANDNDLTIDVSVISNLLPKLVFFFFFLRYTNIYYFWYSSSTL